MSRILPWHVWNHTYTNTHKCDTMCYFESSWVDKICIGGVGHTVWQLQMSDLFCYCMLLFYTKSNICFLWQKSSVHQNLQYSIVMDNYSWLGKWLTNNGTFNIYNVKNVKKWNFLKHCHPWNYLLTLVYQWVWKITCHHSIKYKLVLTLEINGFIL